ncbi:MFS transporter [Uliginosibacterium sp. H1]|uniref:MFS transporter n=1 Tax=Uliginosibacterium sp. H1 TaxID=3114757 RepID=UPI002E18AD2F|nr:MFS transporter [Uliginosibacterium sp. H1]
MNDTSLATTAAPATSSPWAPFRQRVFTVMWFAMLVGNMGTWMRDVGAGWLMTTLSPSATAVAMVQVATTLPIFLLSLPAGALADIVDRRRLLIGINVALGVVAAALGVVTHLGAMTPVLLILGLMCAGIGVALTQPVQQSLTPLLVARPLLRSAVALNSMGLNVSRAIGPALGGVVVASLGVAATFYLDAASYLAVIGALWWWKGASAPAAAGTPEQIGAAMRAGLRYAWHAPALQRVLLRAGSFFIFASAWWALLPIIARRELGGGPGYYGVLLSCVGAGAVAGAILLPTLRARWSAETSLRGGLAATVLVLVLLAAVREQVAAAAVMVLAGGAWIVVLTIANVTAQTQLPNWVRGRGLALYLSVFYGAMALGSFLWGQLADLAGVPAALGCAAGVGALSCLLAWRRPLPEGEPDLSPSGHWPLPVLAPEMAHRLDGEQAERDIGPVLITVEYQVRPQDVAGFLRALHAFSPQRLRDGAWQWGIYEDLARPGIFVEHFLVASWAEHQRQHHRVSVADADLQAHVRAFHAGSEPPQVRHLIAANPPTRP